MSNELIFELLSLQIKQNNSLEAIQHSFQRLEGILLKLTDSEKVLEATRQIQDQVSLISTEVEFIQLQLKG